MLAIGTGIALLPERVFAFAMARVPEGAVTTSLLLLALLLPMPVGAQQHVEQPGSTIQVPASDFEKQMQSDDGGLMHLMEQPSLEEQGQR